MSASAARDGVDTDLRVTVERADSQVSLVLQEAFFAATKGDDQRYVDWLTFVDD